MAGQAVYWVGSDGNVWVKDSSGTTNYGSANDYRLNADGFNGFSQSANPYSKSIGEGAGVFLANQIADPVKAAAPAPTTSQYPALNRGAVNNTQLAIDQIPGLLQAALASEDTKYGNTKSAFDAQETSQRGSYDTNTTTNQQNYDQTFMDSIRAGIKGLAGLRALLAGSGGAGGTAEDQVNEVVGGITADDIRGGANTQKNNQTNLDSSLATFLTDLKGKRQVNEDTYANNRSAIQRDSNTQLQDLYSKMAGFYGDAGQTAQRDAFMAKAGAITPQIAADSRRVVSNYDTTPVAVQAPQLTAFAAPSQPDAAVVPQDGQVGSGIFTIGRKKDQNTTPVMVPQGA